MAVSIGLSIPVVVLSVHLRASIGFAGANIDRLGSLFQAVGSLPLPWAIGADWNLVPEDMQKWAAKAKANVVYSGEPTFGAREL
eukprot:3280736-Pyramimonas_sp.AAC.1